MTSKDRKIKLSMENTRSQRVDIRLIKSYDRNILEKMRYRHVFATNCCWALGVKLIKKNSATPWNLTFSFWCFGVLVLQLWFPMCAESTSQAYVNPLFEHVSMW